MQKIISLFKRNYDGDRLVRNEVVEGAEWVQRGEGFATRKWDGTCCMIKDGKFFKRYDAKKGRTVPPGFIPAQPAPDPETGHWPGWLEVGAGPEDRWHREALQKHEALHGRLADGTYELCGPKVQSNAEGFPHHVLIPHGNVRAADAPRDFEGLREYFRTAGIEGLVWYHPDGRRVKIKAKDFGIQRP